MLGAGMCGHKQMQAAIQAINEFAAEAGKAKWDWKPADRSAVTQFAASYEAQVAQAYTLMDKQQRYSAMGDVRKAASAARAADAPFSENQLKAELHELEAKVVRNRILDGSPRIDGRDLLTRSEERRVGKECVSTCRSTGRPSH